MRLNKFYRHNTISLPTKYGRILCFASRMRLPHQLVTKSVLACCRSFMDMSNHAQTIGRFIMRLMGVVIRVYINRVVSLGAILGHSSETKIFRGGTPNIYFISTMVNLIGPFRQHFILLIGIAGLK